MKTFEYGSRSSKATHIVRVYDDGRITCTCRGFDSPNKCWHYREVLEKENGGTPPAYVKPVATPKAVQPKAVQPSLFTATPVMAMQPVDPMLASALPEGKTIADYGNGWILEEKYDGHRVILTIGADGITTAWSRAGNAKTLPIHLRSALRLLPPGIYDGELYIPGAISTDVTALGRQHELKIVLFDLLSVGEHSAMDKHGSYRRQLLEVACSKLEGCDVSIAPQFAVSPEGLQRIWDRGGEGAVIKRMDCTYRPGKRIKEWIKFKKEQSAQATITGFEAGKAMGSTDHSIIVAVDRHGIEVRMKSLNDAWRAAFATRSHEVIGLTIVFSYQEKTRDGRYRHPMADHILDWKV